LETNYVGSSPTIGIFLYVAQAVERMLTIAFGTHNSHKRLTFIPWWDSNPQSQEVRGHGPTIGIFLYVSIQLKTFTEGNC